MLAFDSSFIKPYPFNFMKYQIFVDKVFVSLQNSKKLIVRKLESCKGERNLPMIFQNLTLTKSLESDGYDFEFIVVVKKEISRNLAVSMVLNAGFSMLCIQT